MAERGLCVDHSTIGRWVLRYAPELNQRIRREIRPPSRSWRVDETYGTASVGGRVPRSP
jgi:transposase-like protein